MLRVTKLSGDEVASIAVGEVRDVKSLKRRLSRLPGLPPRFRQRLLLNGRQLEDAAELDSPTDLQLVLLPFAEVSQGEACEFAAAARQGFAAKVEAMLQLPHDPNSVGPGHSPALVQAAHQGHAEVVALLLEGGADTDLAEATYFGHDFTALIAASRSGHVEVVRLLVEAGANLDMADNRGRTALLDACSRGHVDVARLLLEAGASKDLAESDIRRTALLDAAERGHAEVVRLLLRASKDLAILGGALALMRASIGGHVEVARLLLEAGANKDWANGRGVTSLMQAALRDQAEVVRLLLDAGADTHVAKNNGDTALTLASRFGHAEIVRLLQKADVSNASTGKRRKLP